MSQNPIPNDDEEPTPPDAFSVLASLDNDLNKTSDMYEAQMREMDLVASERKQKLEPHELEYKSAEDAPDYIRRHNSNIVVSNKQLSALPTALSPVPPLERSTSLFALSPVQQQQQQHNNSRRNEMIAIRSSPYMRQSMSLNQVPDHDINNNNNNNDDDDEVMIDEQRSNNHPQSSSAIDLTQSQPPELPSEFHPPASSLPNETRQDLLRLRRLEIALRDANNFPSDTKILDWPKLRQLPQPLQTKDVLRCFVRCRYVVARSWARLVVPKNQTLVSMIRSQQGCTFFVQMTQFFRQLSRVVATQRTMTRAQLAELDRQHCRAASFFEEDFLQPSDNLPPRPIDKTMDLDENEATKRILLGPGFHAAVIVAEACSQPGAVRPEAQAEWELSEQLQGPVASAVNAAFAEIKTWYDWHLRVVPGDLNRVLKDEQALPRFAEWVALLAARERLAFNRRYVPNYVSEMINFRTAQARQWLQAYHNNR